MVNYRCDAENFQTVYTIDLIKDHSEKTGYNN